MTSDRRELLEAALVGLKIQVVKLHDQMADITAELMGTEQPAKVRAKLQEVPKTKKRKMSAAGKAKIAAASRKRWAAYRKANKAKKAA